MVVEYVPITQSGRRHATRLDQSDVHACTPLPRDLIESKAYRESAHLLALLASGKLSREQADAVRIAVARFIVKTRLGDHDSAFLLGDGAGVGKTRTMAAMANELAAFMGCVRILYATCSSELRLGIVKGFEDVFERKISVYPSNNEPLKTLSGDEFGDGVFVVTYSYLSKKNSQAARIDGLVKWASKSPLTMLVLDECHKVKNLKSNVSAAVKQLQARLPTAFIVYCSATASTSLADMSYMSRLTGGGVLTNGLAPGSASVQLITSSLRAQGAYLSRSLSYDGVAFASYDVEMSDEARACYDASVEVWKELCDVKDARRVKQLCKSYFNLFVVAAKVEWVVKTTHDAVAAGRSVVIGMSNTGDTVKLLGEQRGYADTNNVFRSMLLKALDLQNAVGSKRKRRTRAEMNETIVALAIPWDNPMDDLVRLLGGSSCVAELSGRSTTNISNERIAFMSGEKQIALITKAGSTGIDLHAHEGCGSAHRQREFILLQYSTASGIDSVGDLPQQLGRVHRTGQSVPPVITMPFLSDCSLEDVTRSAIVSKLKRAGSVLHGTNTVDGALVLIGDDVLESASAKDRNAAIAMLDERVDAFAFDDDDFMFRTCCLTPLADSKRILDELKGHLASVSVPNDLLLVRVIEVLSTTTVSVDPASGAKAVLHELRIALDVPQWLPTTTGGKRVWLKSDEDVLVLDDDGHPIRPTPADIVETYENDEVLLHRGYALVPPHEMHVAQAAWELRATSVIHALTGAVLIVMRVQPSVLSAAALASIVKFTLPDGDNANELVGLRIYAEDVARVQARFG